MNFLRPCHISKRTYTLTQQSQMNRNENQFIVPFCTCIYAMCAEWNVD